MACHTKDEAVYKSALEQLTEMVETFREAAAQPSRGQAAAHSLPTMELLLKKAGKLDTQLTPAEDKALGHLIGKTQLIADNFPFSGEDTNTSSPHSTTSSSCSVPHQNSFQFATSGNLDSSHQQQPLSDPTDLETFDFSTLPPLQGGVEDADMMDLHGLQPWDIDMVEAMLSSSAQSTGLDPPDLNMPWPLGTYGQPPPIGQAGFVPMDSSNQQTQLPNQSWSSILGFQDLNNQ